MAWPLHPQVVEAPETRESFADHGDKPISSETWKRFLASYDDYFAYIAWLEYRPLYPDVAEQIYHDMIARLAKRQDEIHRPKNDPNGRFRSALLCIFKRMLCDYWRKNRLTEIYAQREMPSNLEASISPLASEEATRQALCKTTYDYVLDYISQKNHDELKEIYGITPRDLDIWKRRFILLMSEKAAGAKYGTKQPEVVKIIQHINAVLREKIAEFLKPFGYEDLFDM